jgi:hypothetical protein
MKAEVGCWRLEVSRRAKGKEDRAGQGEKEKSGTAG